MLVTVLPVSTKLPHRANHNRIASSFNKLTLDESTMNAQTFPAPPRLCSGPSKGSRMESGQDRGSSGVPPIEQRFTGPVRAVPDRGGANPFGPIPRLRKLPRHGAEGFRALITSNASKALTLVLASSAIATYAIHALNGGSMVKINFIWPA